MFVHLFAFYGLCTRIPLLNVSLQGGNLFVYVRYILFNDKSKFLWDTFSTASGERDVYKTYADFYWSIIEERPSFCHWYSYLRGIVGRVRYLH